MRVQVENTGEIGRKMTVSVPAAEFESAMQKRIGELSKSVRLSGFRPGKVPRKVIEKRFGDEIKGEILGGIIERSYVAALDQEGLTPATEPAIEPTTTDRGSDVEYVASFDVFPEINSGEISGVRIEKPICEVVDSDIDTTLERMRNQRVEFETSEETAETGDRVTLDFNGKIDAVAFDGGSAEDYQLVLGSGAVLPDLDSAMVGMKPSDEKSIDVSFPDDYPKEELAGKKAVFDVVMKEIAKPKLPELDEDFVKGFGIEDGDMTRLRDEIRNSLERERNERVEGRIKEQVLSALGERNSFELPAKMVESEIDSMIESSKQMMQSRGVQAPEELTDADREGFREEARRRVALGLIMRSIIKTESMEADADRVRDKIASISQGYDQPEQVMQYYYSDAQRRAQIEAIVIEEQVVEHLLKTADVEEVNMTFSEFMYPETEATEATGQPG